MAARARAVIVLLAAASGCGRVGFAPVGDAAAVDNAILAVSPIWAGPDGARIEVTALGSGRRSDRHARWRRVLVAAAPRRASTRRWITQVGTSGDDQAWDLAVDASGAVVVAARTTGAFAPASNAGGLDYVVLRFSPDGVLEWARQGGSAAVDQGHSVTVTPDGITYLVGYTDGVIEPGATNAGGVDLFVARYERDGTPTWIRQRGGAGDDRAQDVTVDDAGDVWIVGETSGALDGNPVAGGRDVFVMRMSASGVWAFTRVHGSPAAESTYGVAVTPTGEVYVSCVTGAAFDGQSYVLLGIVPLATGLLGSCPLYTLLGISTCPMKRDAPARG